MHFVRNIFVFYKKLFFPTVIASAIIGTIGAAYSDSTITNEVGKAYVFVTPFIQYFIYEVDNPKEYYYYYNLGISKSILWITTIVISSIVGLLAILL